MNTVDEQILKVIVKPYQVVNIELCCWEIVCLVSTWGGDQKRVFRACSKKEIDRYVPGYTIYNV